MSPRLVIAAIFASTVTSAAAAGSGAISIEGPHARMMVVPEAPPSFIPARIAGKGLVTIYDSLASKYPKGRYWCCSGYNVMGTGQGEQWMAAPFTPGADHTVTRIEVGAGWSQGPNGVVVSLDSDSNGIPGTTLKSWHVNGLPLFGTCCTLVVNTDSAGIPVSAGKQYWVVLSTTAKEAQTVDGWNESDEDQVDAATMASFSSNTWHVFQANPGLAFAVRGSN